MEFFFQFADFILHLDKYLSQILQQYGNWTYLALFLIIFCETGLVATPFLPGDSLLFVIGAFGANKSINLWTSFVVLSAAAILGDTVNYWIGAYLGPRVFHYNGTVNESTTIMQLKKLIFRKEYLEKTHRFYEKYGAKTIIIARFVPIVRTFAPFVAGVGTMTYSKFLFYNISGGILWVTSLLLAGYYFGNIPIIKNNLSYAILTVIVLSILPGIIEYIKTSHKSQVTSDK
ncbi:MAG: DedA family protein [Elusimicrobia bacterium]|nr:DedA family protein [Elusimicrobiota bacterium]